MPLAVVTINNPSPALTTRNAEVYFVNRAMDIAESQIRAAGGFSASGTMTDQGVTVGTWTYTAVASS
jgi:hypothetical protein